MPTINRLQNLISPPAIVREVEWNDQTALRQLGEELKGVMPEDKITNYVNFIEGLCKKFNIHAKNLPINSEHPGNLTSSENKKILDSVINGAIFDKIV